LQNSKHFFPENMTTHERSDRYLQAAICFAAVTILLLLLWFASDIFLLVFGGVLLAIIFRSAADLVARFTKLTPGWALLVVLLLVAGLVFLTVVFLSPTIANQVDQLQADVPAAWDGVQGQLQQYRWGRELLNRGPSAIGSFSYGRGTWSHILGAFSAALSVIADALVIFFLGLYFVIDPALYRRGLLALVPKDNEARAGQVLDRLYEQLRHWMLGKLALMLFVGVFTAAGLRLLHMPLVIALAAIAALLDFIPNIGPIISAIPAVLLALTQGPKEALLVALLYLTVQIVENYILQPIVQQRAVSLPPSLTLGAQIVIGTIFGVIGLIFATPLTVVLMNLTQMLYVEDFLNKRSDKAQ
jgi:predicted PurR-regulated permease PerM